MQRFKQCDGSLSSSTLKTPLPTHMRSFLTGDCAEQPVSWCKLVRDLPVQAEFLHRVCALAPGVQSPNTLPEGR
jgi:hypothetical protein